MARPTKIRETHIEVLNEYLDECWDSYEEFRKSESTSQFWGSESWGQRLNVKLPTLAGLYLKYRKYERENKLFNFSIAERTFQDWRDKWEELSSNEEISEEDMLFVEFSRSFNELLKLQEQMLVNWGVSNQYWQVVTKLLLSANHGYKEKSETDVKHSWSVDLGGFFGDKESEDKKESLVW